MYQHASGREAIPLLYASREEGLSVRDINLTCPLSEVSYDSLSSNSFFIPLVDIEDTPVEDGALVSSVYHYASSDSESEEE